MVKKILTSLTLFSLFNLTSSAQNRIYTGIPVAEMNWVASAQQNTQWCWASSIQMVLNKHRVAITQEQIVFRTFGVGPTGQLPNFPGSIEVITRNLNNWNFDNNGNRYTVMSRVFNGAPTPAVMLNVLGNKQPMIIGYRSGPNTQHAVVLTGMSYIPGPNGPIVTSLIVRDPWPSAVNRLNNGRVEHFMHAGAGSFEKLITNHWYIGVRKQ